MSAQSTPFPATARQRVAVLGSTGSIGRSTLDVLARHPDRFAIAGIAARQDVDGLLEQVRAFAPLAVIATDERAAEELRARLRADGSDVVVHTGSNALVELASDNRVDTVMAGVVGAAGLASTLAAARAGKRILLANKEALVMAGALMMQLVRDNGAVLVPVDSEHNAIFQCLPPAGSRVGVRKILLTASGGPFRDASWKDLRHVTPQQALAHPNWRMGPKISIDSATMMNKGLELIEACWLFDVAATDIEIVIHPESIVHSLVEYADGSVLAQLGEPDMRTPIAHALAWPERIDSGVARLDLVARAQLRFEAPDYERFPCLGLARRAATVGGTAPAILNAANEVAVAAFLQGRAGFMDIPAMIAAALDSVPVVCVDTIACVLEADRSARAAAMAWLNRRAG